MIDIWIEKKWRLDGSELDDNVVWLDIETRKVSAPEGWPYSRRWQPFMVSMCGAMESGFYASVVSSESESELIAWLSAVLKNREVRYAASREFDEMVLRGHFTNARRAHNPYAGPWPNLDDVPINWINIDKILSPVARSEDCESKDVPKLWKLGERELVARHCLRDSIEMVLGDPTIKLSRKLRRELEKEMS